MEEQGTRRERPSLVPKVAVGLGIEFVGSGVFVFKDTLRIGGIGSPEFAPLPGEKDFSYPKSSEVMRLVYTDMS